MLFNEPKLLKFNLDRQNGWAIQSFSALQRAEIAEIEAGVVTTDETAGFSALQRAEIAEMALGVQRALAPTRFQCSSTSRNC